MSFPASTVALPATPISGAQEPPGAGTLSASSIILTADGQTTVATAPIRLFSKLVEVDVYSGAGTPSFKANTGSLFMQNDTAALWMNVSASPSGTTWALVAVQSGTGFVTLTTNQTISGQKTFSVEQLISATGDSLSSAGQILATRGSGTTATYLGPIYTIAGNVAVANTAHGVVGTAVFNGAVASVAITLSADARFTSGTSYMVGVDQGVFTGVNTVQFFVGSKSATGFTVYAVNTTTGAAATPAADTIPFFAWGT